ncbi:MAG: DNA-processing protein DprA, partial [Pseudomonadota bacterium]
MAALDRAALPLLAPSAAPLSSLSEAERLARLRLARSHNVGPRTFAHLVSRFRTAEAALEALPALARRGGSSEYTAVSLEAAEAEAEAAATRGIRLVILGDPDYPALLGRIDTPPPVLMVRGRMEVFARSGVALVGARNASALGLRTARRLAADLGAMGHVIVSGLARGIDASAHEVSLESGTVAVLAGGLDRLYPPENTGLAERIAETGALVTECALGVEPTGRHFPKRNRLIAGLSLGVVLVEAAMRSGSLITARYALDQGREVMAVPGAPEDPRASGCNAFIRDGAALIRNAEDVREVLYQVRAAPESGPPGLAEAGAPFQHAPAETASLWDDGGMAWQAGDTGCTADADLTERVAGLLSPSPVDLDELARASGARPTDLSLALLELDLAGRI